MYCKNCNVLLDPSNIYPKDKRYCIICGSDYHNYLQERKQTLRSLQEMSLAAKIVQSKYLITCAIREFGLSKVYVSYSGGRDSTVLSHITKTMYPSILHLFANTTNEYPETLEHVRWEKEQNGTNVVTVFPYDSKGNPWTFERIVKDYGYPLFSKRISNAIRTYQHARTSRTKQNSIDYINRNFKKYSQYMELPISDKCCDKLKKEPLRKKAKELGLQCAIIGLLASESYQREKEWLEYGCNVFHTRADNQCRPLSFWLEDDILEYIETNKIKISKLYSMGYNRNGCMYCGFGVHLEKMLITDTNN